MTSISVERPVSETCYGMDDSFQDYGMDDSFQETCYDMDDWYGAAVKDMGRDCLIHIYIMLISLLVSVLVILFGVLLEEPVVILIGVVLLFGIAIAIFCVSTPVLSGILKVWNFIINGFSGVRNSVSRSMSWRWEFMSGYPRFNPINRSSDADEPFHVVYHTPESEVVMNSYAMGDRTSTAKLPPKRRQRILEQDNLQLSELEDSLVKTDPVSQPVHQTQSKRKFLPPYQVLGTITSGSDAGYQPESNRRLLQQTQPKRRPLPPYQVLGTITSGSKAGYQLESNRRLLQKTQPKRKLSPPYQQLGSISSRSETGYQLESNRRSLQQTQPKRKLSPPYQQQGSISSGSEAGYQPESNRRLLQHDPPFFEATRLLGISKTRHPVDNNGNSEETQ